MSMKKIVNCLLVAALAFAVSSCYKDKGNYDYEPVDDVKLSGFELSGYSKIALKDVLHIDPVIDGMSGSDFSYIWALCKAYNENDATYKGVPPIDTISREKILDFPVEIAPGQYFLYFTVTNNNGGVSYYHKSDLTVTTEFATGFYVLKEVSGNTDMDMHKFDSEVLLANVIKGIQGVSMPGKPENFGCVPLYGYLNEKTARFGTTRALSVGAGGAFNIFNTEDMSVIWDHSTMFYGGDAPREQPLFMTGHSTGISYVSDKGSYYSYQLPTWGMSGAGKFGSPGLVGDNADYTPSPHVFAMRYGSDGMMVYNEIYLFDTKHGRFVTVDFNGNAYPFQEFDASQAPLAISPNGIQHKLLFFGGTPIAGSNAGEGFALFQDKSDAQQRYLYFLQFKNGDSKHYNPMRKIVTLDKSLKFSQATLFAMNETDGYAIYFVHNNQVYLYDIVAGTETALTLNGLGSGEEITYIRHVYFTQFSNQKFNYFVVGTSNGGKYKVYMYEKVGVTPMGAPKRILQGDGKPFGLHFVSSRMNDASAAYYSGGR